MKFEMLLRNAQMAPPHDSPSNILNTLNDDCIQAILVRITNVPDFANASQACERFQENAKLCFPSRFKSIELCSCELFKNREALLSFFRIFGNSIRSISWKCSKLRCRYGKNDDFNWFFRKFKQLLELDTKSFNQFSPAMLTKFLQLNPQLKRVAIYNDRFSNQTISFLRGLIHAPSIEGLTIAISNDIFDDTNFQLLANLKKLKYLNISMNRSLGGDLVTLMAENGLPIEELKIDAADDVIQPLLKLKNLRKLNISHISIDAIMAFVAEKPLETLDFLHYSITAMQFSEIITHSKDIRNISFQSFNLQIDQKVFEKIFRLAKNRTKVHLITNEKIDIPDNILAANREWLTIETYFKAESDQRHLTYLNTFVHWLMCLIIFIGCVYMFYNVNVSSSPLMHHWTQ